MQRRHNLEFVENAHESLHRHLFDVFIGPPGLPDYPTKAGLVSALHFVGTYSPCFVPSASVAGPSSLKTMVSALFHSSTLAKTFDGLSRMFTKSSTLLSVARIWPAALAGSGTNAPAFWSAMATR